VSAEPSRPVRFGCSYFGVRDPDYFEADLAAIARGGCSWVLFPFSHDDAHWEASTFRALVAAAERHGLEPVISPWGGDDFGGEGVQTELPTRDWLARARATGASILHVDEPKAGRLTIGEVLDAWGDDARTWLTVEPHRAGILDQATIGRVGVLGTDAYSGTLDEREAATRAFREQTGRLDLAWVQAFRVADGGEPAVADAVCAMAELAPRVGIWGWKGSTGRGELRSANPGGVQEAVERAIAAVREGARRAEPVHRLDVRRSVR
jgi:hypothetical protein